MFSHHKAAIERIKAEFNDHPEVLAVLLGGSIAHGFAQEASDVDVMIVVSDDEHANRTAAGSLHYYSTDLCDYQGGYVDGKYISPSFINAVEEKGSDPARFAFEDAQILLSRIDGWIFHPKMITDSD